MASALVTGLSHAPPPAQVKLTATYSKETIAEPRVAALPVAAPSSVIVVSGNTLSEISGAHCGTPADYPALAKASGVSNPNLIYPGQKIVLDCKTGVLAAKTAPADPPPGKTYGVTYGDPNYCGDGDGDGWDVACHTPADPPADPPATHQYTPVAHSYTPAQTVQASGSFSAGTLTFAQIEALWVAAGGPSWAEVQAATVAECESGGRTNAYNPSGATGVFQILGSVVGGNLDDPMANALNAVAKFKASGDTFAQWVCKP
jgi:LysM repeat protein